MDLKIKLGLKILFALCILGSIITPIVLWQTGFFDSSPSSSTASTSVVTMTASVPLTIVDQSSIVATPSNLETPQTPVSEPVVFHTGFVRPDTSGTPDGWISMGCFNDDANDRMMTRLNAGDGSVDSCKVAAKAAGYNTMNLQNTYMCFASSEPFSYDKYSQTACFDSSRGSDDVYQLEEVAAANANNAQWLYKGCFSDALPTQLANTKSKGNCLNQAKAANLQFAGSQCETCGGECWAGGPESHYDAHGSVLSCDNPLGNNNATQVFEYTIPSFVEPATLIKAGDMLPTSIQCLNTTDPAGDSIKLSALMSGASTQPVQLYGPVIKLHFEWPQPVIISEIKINAENFKFFTLLRDNDIAVQYWNTTKFDAQSVAYMKTTHQESMMLQTFKLKYPIYTDRCTFVINPVDGGPFYFHSLLFL